MGVYVDPDNVSKAAQHIDDVGAICAGSDSDGMRFPNKGRDGMYGQLEGLALAESIKAVNENWDTKSFEFSKQLNQFEGNLLYYVGQLEDTDTVNGRTLDGTMCPDWIDDVPSASENEKD